MCVESRGDDNMVNGSCVYVCVEGVHSKGYDVVTRCEFTS